MEGKIAKRLRKRKLINECRGPGIYNPEMAFGCSSKAKWPSQGKIMEGTFSRFILPKTQAENLFLASSSSHKHLTNAAFPPPGRYSSDKKYPSLSTLSRLPTYKMSTTQRSSILREDGGRTSFGYR